MDKNFANTERVGVHACALVIETMGLIFREQPICDYGIDAIIETKLNGYASGKMIAVQIKSGDSYFSEIKDDSVIYRGEKKHYDYWINHSLPVIIVLYSPSSQKCIWAPINKGTTTKSKNGWKIAIPSQQLLNNAQLELTKLAENQTDYEMRMNSLVVAKEWMVEAQRKGFLILEVQEWVNKCSGRGSFILKTTDDGIEKILFARELYGFGTKKYELVIQELFPWADIAIDEAFYRENLEDNYVDKYSFSDCIITYNNGSNRAQLPDSSGALHRIYPYRNGAGEVDFYRLKLTLNSIGNSFICVENFLETGTCYFMKRFL